MKGKEIARKNLTEYLEKEVTWFLDESHAAEDAGDVTVAGEYLIASQELGKVLENIRENGIEVLQKKL